ncbi:MULTISPECIES: DUF6319 family protein [unclassified Saccharopolyspora]|uniref:DUF6319 family protein n=1 Tax=unclassified Saccharopolyspora TaxID=2646250 RepID=UPI001CD79598|nr:MULTISPECIES: DUF6319 family protein [unclassified Saccharopolyspora]MCA1187883.1 DUF6319 family protein [Saccharopolyspora sp. 6T]MCA1191111.1 DUF6319 family protein [Saccharopolyspora sp. 6V]MCA1225759.1 DUF6319 family protein [Saccharopolyspora sp. 6M]MCA1278627.1 DUF6319 family protein [Saccharopolyspora sp. 7B]
MGEQEADQVTSEETQGEQASAQPENGTAQAEADTAQAAATPSEPAAAAPAPADAAPADATPEPAPKKTRAPKKSTAKKTRTVELTLTVTGTAEGEWQAELMHAGKRVVQGLPVPAAAVSKAAAELHQDISEAIEEVLSAAREQHEAKLAELEAEVERVRKALLELEG